VTHNNSEQKPIKKQNLTDLWRSFQKEVDRKSSQKIRAKQEGDRSLWFGLGMYGLVGWSISIPTVLGVALGVWIDTNFSSRYSWTLMMLFLGLFLGCWNAWYWIQRAIRED